MPEIICSTVQISLICSSIYFGTSINGNLLITATPHPTPSTIPTTTTNNNNNTNNPLKAILTSQNLVSLYEKKKKISTTAGGWSDGAMVSCIIRHRGVQLILAYSWAKPAILVAGKGRGGIFLFLHFLHFYSCSSLFPVPLFHLFYYLFYRFSPFLWETTKMTHKG